MKTPREQIVVTDEILDEFPELDEAANDYLRKRINIGGPVKHLNGSRCWIFTGHVKPDGYGVANFSSVNVAKMISFTCLAHRLAYMIWVDRITKGVIQHKCDHPCCINPDHLQDETKSENTRDGFRRREFASPFNKTWKLTVHAIRMIRTLSRQGNMSVEDIAKAFNVCDDTVYRIKNGDTYSFIV
jgi:hypothetical protein